MKSPGSLYRAAALIASLSGSAPLHAEDLAAGDDLVARFDVCYDFGCKTRRGVVLFESDWRAVVKLLRGSSDAHEERRRIADAIGLMERIVATMTPTGADRAFNDDASGKFVGQLDCIDESTNTYRYLSLFEEHGLLAWHRVRDRLHRTTLIAFEHWAAQIEDTRTGARYAVDSWFGDNGEPAVIATVDAWRRREVSPPSSN